MLERIAGNEELKSSIRRMLEGRRLTHSVLLVGEAGLGAGFAARCVAADKNCEDLPMKSGLIYE